MEILFHQYELIHEGREPFFAYCASIKSQHFLQDLDSFGGRSIRSLLVHIANTYHFWLGHFAEIKKTSFAKPEDFRNMNDVQKLFDTTDLLMKQFLKESKDKFEEAITNTVPMREFKIEVMPLQLFTHVITHEYHHKGQVLSMSRELGYLPVDTDLIRF